MSCPHYLSEESSSWTYQQPRKNKNGGMSVNLQKSPTTMAAPRVQLERLRCPFGVQDGLEASSRKNLEIAISLEPLREWARALDAQNITWIVDNSMTLFKKEMKQATVEALYRPLLTTPSNAAYDPLLRLKINSDGLQATNVMVVIEEGTAESPLKWRHGTLADVERQTEVIPLVEVTGLWFVSKGCGMTLVATDLLVFPKRRRGFDFYIPFAAGAVRASEEDETTIVEPPASVVMSSTASALTEMEDVPSN